MIGNSWRDLGITEAEVEEIVRRVLAARGEGVSRPAAPEGYCIHAVKTSFFGRGSVRMLGPDTPIPTVSN